MIDVGEHEIASFWVRAGSARAWCRHGLNEDRYRKTGNTWDHSKVHGPSLAECSVNSATAPQHIGAVEKSLCQKDFPREISRLRSGALLGTAVEMTASNWLRSRIEEYQTPDLVSISSSSDITIRRNRSCPPRFGALGARSIARSALRPARKIRRFLRSCE